MATTTKKLRGNIKNLLSLHSNHLQAFPISRDYPYKSIFSEKNLSCKIIRILLHICNIAVLSICTAGQKGGAEAGLLPGPRPPPHALLHRGHRGWQGRGAFIPIVGSIATGTEPVSRSLEFQTSDSFIILTLWNSYYFTKVFSNMVLIFP